MSSSSVVSLSSFNLLFFTQVLTVLTSSIKYSEYVTDKGKNISIPCTADGDIMWVKESATNNTILQTGKFLVLTNVTAADEGVYLCFASVPPHSNTSIAAATDDKALDNGDADANRDNGDSDVGDGLIDESVKESTVTATATAIPTSTAVSLAVPNADASTTSPLPWPTQPATVPSDQKNNSSTRPSTSTSTSTSTTTTTKTKTTKTTKTKETTMTIQRFEEREYQEFQKVNLSVRTPPGPVTQLYFKASTILGFLVWRFNKTNSGGYPVRSFTAEFRNVSYNETPYNSTFEHDWNRMDPINIAPNVRQMEVYRLEPNTTYEFRIWANNQLGSGEVVTTNVTTLPETKEEDLIRLIQPDLDNFDPRIWIVAVSVVLGTLVILAIGLCIVLTKECYQSSQAGIESNSNSTSRDNTAAHTSQDCQMNVIVIA